MIPIGSDTFNMVYIPNHYILNICHILVAGVWFEPTTYSTHCLDHTDPGALSTRRHPLYKNLGSMVNIALPPLCSSL